MASIPERLELPRLSYPIVENGVAHGLAREAYTDPLFLRTEYERLFARSWTFVGFAHELPDAGDARPITVAGRPIVLVRDAAGGIGAFHNVCRHRGHPVVGAACRGLKALVCPYHAWTYGLDGKLERTPHFGGYAKPVEGFDYERHGLAPVRCAAWHDWLFIDLTGEAPALDEHVAPLGKYLDGLRFDRLRPIAKIDLGVVNANWKFLVENFIEPYHVPVVHRTSAGGQPLKEHYMIVDGRCVGCAVDVAAGVGESSVHDPSDQLDMSTRYLTLFPNFVIAWYLPDQVGVHLNVPLAPDRTHQWRVIYHAGESPPDEAAVSALVDLWTQVHREDHAIVEGLQAARASPVLDDGGLLSPYWETSVRRFQELVVDAMA